MRQYWMYDHETQADYAEPYPPPLPYLSVAADTLVRQARTEAAAYRYWMLNTRRSLAEVQERHTRLLCAVDELEQGEPSHSQGAVDDDERHERDRVIERLLALAWAAADANCLVAPDGVNTSPVGINELWDAFHELPLAVRRYYRLP